MDNEKLKKKFNKWRTIHSRKYYDQVTKDYKWETWVEEDGDFNYFINMET